MSDPLASEGLFDYQERPPVGLADRFGVPPFSILDRRQGSWQDRKRAWLSLGIQSELGRDIALLGGGLTAGNTGKGMATAMVGGVERARSGAYGGKAITDPVTGELSYEVAQGATSIFDPVIAELAYRWYSAPGWRVLDPFAGGSVRGVVAGVLGRKYLGIDLREEQVVANRSQDHIAPAASRPAWLVGDSRSVIASLPAGALCDMVFTCPPYADLEVYSDDPSDLSNMPYPEFLAAQLAIIEAAYQRLRPNRFFGWVTSDVRDKKVQGSPYRGLVVDTITACQSVGLGYYNDIVILDPVGTAAVRAGRQFTGGRKVIRMHQHLLIFYKGDPMAATKELEVLGGHQAAEDAERAMMGGA